MPADPRPDAVAVGADGVVAGGAVAGGALADGADAWWRSSGLSDLVRGPAAATPDGVALVDGPYRVQWAELDDLVDRTARALRVRGLRPGDRVVLHLSTGRQFVQLLLGCARAGLVAVPVDAQLDVPGLRHVLLDCAPRLLVTQSVPVLRDVSGLLAGTPVQTVLVAARAAPDELVTVDEAVRRDGDGPPVPPADAVGEAPAVLLYTSGTTALPRAAVLPARALLANVAQSAGQGVVGPGDTVLLALPLSHAFGLNGGLGPALHAGATVVLPDHLGPADTLPLVREHGVTVVVAPPAVHAGWAADPAFPAAVAGVRLALSGSAALDRPTRDALAAAGVAVREGYGLTETGPTLTLAAADSAPGSVGRPLPGVELVLLDADGEPVGSGADDPGSDVADPPTAADDPGEVVVRGPNLFTGYWPDGAGGPGSDGWWPTGDVAVRDDAGDLHLVGRLGDVAVVAGFRVHAGELEAALAATPGVAEVSAVAVADGTGGTVFDVWVVAAPGATGDPDAVLAAAAARLPRYKHPRAVHVVDRLPRTPTGKVVKWQLAGPPRRHGGPVAP